MRVLHHQLDPFLFRVAVQPIIVCILEVIFGFDISDSQNVNWMLY